MQPNFFFVFVNSSEAEAGRLAPQKRAGAGGSPGTAGWWALERRPAGVDGAQQRPPAADGGLAVWGREEEHMHTFRGNWRRKTNSAKETNEVQPLDSNGWGKINGPHNCPIDDPLFYYL